jgi:hypothetical protein
MTELLDAEWKKNLRELTLSELTIKDNLEKIRERLKFTLQDIMACEHIPFNSKLELMYNGSKADWRLDSLIHEFNYPLKDLENDKA